MTRDKFSDHSDDHSPDPNAISSDSQARSDRATPHIGDDHLILDIGATDDILGKRHGVGATNRTPTRTPITLETAGGAQTVKEVGDRRFSGALQFVQALMLSLIHI